MFDVVKRRSGARAQTSGGRQTGSGMFTRVGGRLCPGWVPAAGVAVGCAVALEYGCEANEGIAQNATAGAGAIGYLETMQAPNKTLRAPSHLLADSGLSTVVGSYTDALSGDQTSKTHVPHHDAPFAGSAG